MYELILNQIEKKIIKRKFPKTKYISNESYKALTYIIDFNTDFLSVSELAKLTTLLFNLRNK